MESNDEIQEKINNLYSINENLDDLEQYLDNTIFKQSYMHIMTEACNALICNYKYLY